MAETKRILKNKLLIAIIAVALIAGIIVAVVVAFTGNSEGRQMTEVTSTLKKILEVSDLETAQIIYNAVAKKTAEDNETVLYYAAYEGTIKAGIDFSKVDITPDKETKTITVTLPPAEVLETNVNSGTIEYIFMNKKAETESVAAEAYALCIKDLENRSVEDADKLLETATENAKKAIEGLFEPWLIQSYKDYTLTIQ